jgi:pimeloyl-ACP methyl ester carboxylesterase
MAGMSVSVRRMRVVLDSGRRVAVHRTATQRAWHVSDSREEHLVVLCHSAPGAGAFDPDPAVTQARNVRLLSIDRPGYGRSDPVATGHWATVASAADDLAAVLDSLQVERVGVVGWSAGGRVALALAARRPDLVSRLVVVATPAPDDKLPWIADGEREALERLRDLPPAEAHAALCERLDEVVPADPFDPEALWVLGAGPTDEPVLRAPGVLARLGQMLAAAFAEGARGLAADIAGYCLQPWGFEPAAVEARTLLLYGSHDPIAEPRHGRWWHAQLPDARLEIAPGTGHLLVIPMWTRVLEHLIPQCPRLRAVDGSWNSGPDDDVEEFSAA